MNAINTTATSFPVRIQFCCNDRLVAECIVESHEAERTTAAFFRLKNKHGKPMGGAIRSNRSSVRFWNVPVGSVINEGS